MIDSFQKKEACGRFNCKTLSGVISDAEDDIENRRHGVGNFISPDSN